MTWSCPCGDAHSDKPDAHALLKGLKDGGLSETLDVFVAGHGNHSWRVPRAWVLLHGLAGAGWAELAQRYGWVQLD